MAPFHLIGARDFSDNKVYVPLNEAQGRLFGNLGDGQFTELSGDLERQKGTAEAIYHLKAAAATGMPIQLFAGLEAQVARDLNYLPTLYEAFLQKTKRARGAEAGIEDALEAMKI